VAIHGFYKVHILAGEQGAFLSVIAKLQDPFEGSFARGNEVLRPMVYKHIPNPYGVTAGEVVQRLRDHVAVSCWHINERESAAMWKLYSNPMKQCAFKAHFESCKNAVRAVAQSERCAM